MSSGSTRGTTEFHGEKQWRAARAKRVQIFLCEALWFSAVSVVNLPVHIPFAGG